MQLTTAIRMPRRWYLIGVAPANINTAAAENGVSDTPLQLAISNRRKDMLQFLAKPGVEMSKNQRVRVSKILAERVVYREAG